MLIARYKKHTLNFIRPAGTSRGMLLMKDSYFIIISDTDRPGISGVGECSIIKGLSPDDRPELEAKLTEVCNNIAHFKENQESLSAWPAIRFGVETALADFKNGGKQIIFPSAFPLGNTSIPIHGLIWMGNPESMIRQIDLKLSQGFHVIKMKIGAVTFNEDLQAIRYIRQKYASEDVEIRLDANGAFRPGEATEKLKRLAAYHIHSVEQPIRWGQPGAMAELCLKSPVPIALDEELIGITGLSDKIRLLETIRPQYIVLKPSLLGGFKESEVWIREAERIGTRWWISSALESNIGLNAIAQWTSTLKNNMVQGLGTGSLFSNNIPSPLKVYNGRLCSEPGLSWDLSAIL